MPTDRPAPAYSGTSEPYDRRDVTPRLWDQAVDDGSYRRRIIVRGVADGVAAGELEDDFHHFRVTLRHDGTVVHHIEGTGIRGPWSTCMDAGTPLREVEGTRLSTHPSVLGAIDARRNCTHMFDLAGLVITQAARSGADDRRYDIQIFDLDEGDDRRSAILWRDGVEELAWELHEGEISAPAEWVGAPLRSKFIPWACDRFAGDDDSAEAAIVLRRALDISRGRAMDLDGMETAAPLLAMMEGICHSMTAANAPVAIRQKGSARDFTDEPALLLGDFESRTP
jgi:hypothetical protein